MYPQIPPWDKQRKLWEPLIHNFLMQDGSYFRHRIIAIYQTTKQRDIWGFCRSVFEIFYISFPYSRLKLSHSDGQAFQEESLLFCLTLQDGTDMLPETSVTKYKMLYSTGQWS